MKLRGRVQTIFVKNNVKMTFRVESRHVTFQDYGLGTFCEHVEDK